MIDRIRLDRMDTVRRAVLLRAGAVLAACGRDQEGDMGRHEEEVSPAEHVMREHGVLKRVLRVYAEATRRIEDGRADLPADALKDAATLVRTFIEDHHEELEEDHLFPRFRKANVLVDLVDVLQAQHDAGRRLTKEVLRLANAGALEDAARRRRLAEVLRAFVRMHEPHEAREDTVLFPALRKIVSPGEYAALGRDFEEKEHALFGEGGFEKTVERVARIENAFEIDDLASFTPKG